MTQTTIAQIATAQTAELLPRLRQIFGESHSDAALLSFFNVALGCTAQALKAGESDVRSAVDMGVVLAGRKAERFTARYINDKDFREDFREDSRRQLQS
jgi:hypothetical protein